MGIKQEEIMTIIRGVSIENEKQDSLELNLGTGAFLRLPSRQNSFLSELSALPDFTNLLTPNLQNTAFDFEQSLYNSTDMSSMKMPVARDEMTKFTPQVTMPTGNIKVEQLSPLLGPASQPITSQPEFTNLAAAISQSNGMTNYPTLNQTTASSPNNIKQEMLDAKFEESMVKFKPDGSYEMLGAPAQEAKTYAMLTPQQKPDYSKMDDSQDTDAALLELQNKITKASRELNIPKNPWQWTVEEVNRWVNWLLTGFYEMEPKFSLNLDGTQLCMEKNLHMRVNNQQGVAEILRIEIDLWAQAYSIEQQWNAKQAQQASYTSTEQQLIYTDLSESRPVTSQCNIPSSMPSIPIPVPAANITSMLPPQPQQHSPSNHHIGGVANLTLNEYHQQLQYEYNQNAHVQVRPGTLPINIQPIGSQISPNFNASINSSQGWDSPRSCESGFSGSQQTDYSSMEDDSRECSPAPPQTVPRGPLPHSRNSIKLWQFLRGLLDQQTNSCIRWVDREKGIFKIEDSQKVAKLWGQRKNRPAMNYDKLSRSIRQYYKKKIIKKTDNSKRLVYQFCAPYL